MSHWLIDMINRAERLEAACPVVLVTPEKKMIVVSHGLPIVRDENGCADFAMMVDAFWKTLPEGEKKSE